MNEESLHVLVILWLQDHRVVHIPGSLPPGIENDVLISMIGVQCRHHPFNWIVEDDWADTNDFGKLEIMNCAEKRLVLPDGLPLVIEDRPSRPYPAWADDWAAIRDW